MTDSVSNQCCQPLRASLPTSSTASTAPTREDRRSLAFHHAVAQKLRAEPEWVLRRARRHLDKLAAQNLHPYAVQLLARWDDWLQLPVEDLAKAITTMDDWLARDLRQMSPFAGILTANERRLVLAEFRRCELADELTE